MDILKVELTEEQKTIFEECKKSLDKHGQAAVLLSMGGGKSFIAAKLFRELKKNKKNFNVIWVTTLNDLNKAKSLMSDSYFSDSIHYVTFTKLQRENTYADELAKEHKKYDLIVIDEAHHALATQTYKGVSYLLDKFSDAKLLVMTATKRRYSDRKHIFEWLTPKLQLGVDYNDRGLKYAIDNKITCDFVYKSCNIQMLKDYCKAVKELQQYSVLYNQFDKLIEDSQKFIDDYSNNVFKKLGEKIQQDLEFDGSEGDRWFVFYHWIDELKENRNAIEEMFKIAYNNPNININIIEYHSEITDKNIVDKIVCEPTPNQVDVILTCNRGAESLHPKHTRGIIMLRKTMSGTIFEQQLGRALEIRETCDYVKYVYDCVDNRSNVEKSESIYNGTDKPDERRIASMFKKASSSDDVLNNLQKKYGDTFDVEVMDEDIVELLKQFDNIKGLFEDLVLAGKIHTILCSRTKGGNEYKNIITYGTFSPKGVLSRFDEEHGTKFAQSFYNIQKRFISGFFGEHYVDEEPIKDIYYELYNMFGDTLYLVPGCTDNCDYKLEDLIKIASEVKRFNFDYRNSISKTKELKHKIAELRALNLRGKLSESFMTFCRRNKIDINGIYSNLIREVLDSEDAIKYTEITNKFKELNRLIKGLETKLDSGDYSKEYIEEYDLKDTLLDIIAKEQVFTLLYSNNEYGSQASIALNIKYKKILKLAKSFLTRDEYNRATLIIRALRKINIFLGKDDNTESVLKSITMDIEYPIIDLVRRNEQNKVSDYELYILENLGIKVINNAHRNSNIKKLIDKTPFGITYNKFIETSSDVDYKRLSNYKIEGLPEYAQKLLKSKAYKTSEKIVEQSKLLEKESKSVEDAVRSLFYYDEDTINIIRNAVKQQEIDSRKIIKYAIPNTIYVKNKKYFDEAFVTPWSKLERNTTEIILKSLGNSEACFDCIIESLLEANLLPEEQLELANKLISVAQ